MFGFLFRRTKKINNNLYGRERAIPQSRLDNFQTAKQEKEPYLFLRVSIEEIEEEVGNVMKDFRSYIDEIKEVSMKIDELSKMFKRGEITGSVYQSIMKELSNSLSFLVDRIFNLREILETAKAKAKLEWTKERIRMKAVESDLYLKMVKGESHVKRVSSPIHRWEEIISRIDRALSYLTIEDEVTILSHYLSSVKWSDGATSGGSDGIERAKSLCKQRMNMITDRWSSIRRNKIEEVINLEFKASQIKEKIKEVEVRFAVGEFNQSIYEYKISNLKGTLKKIEEKISNLRRYINDVDMKIFRCLELLRETP